MRTGSFGSVPSLRLAFIWGCEVEAPLSSAGWVLFLGVDLFSALGAIGSQANKPRSRQPINKIQKL